jgi:outer membrane protein TolC
MLMVRDWSTPLSRPWDLNQAQVMISVQQNVVSKQKRDLRANVAGDDAEMAASDLESLRQDVAAAVRKACADLARNSEEMKLHDRQSAVLKEALAAALAQYTTGRAPQADVLRAQMAVTRLDEHLIELEQERDGARAALATLMGRPADEDVEVAGEYSAAVEMPPLEEMERLAMEHRPELAGLRKGIGKSQELALTSRLAMKPDFTVALGYMLMPTGSLARNAYMAEVTTNLPGLNRARHEGEAKQADAATAVAEADLEARTATVFLEVRQAQIAITAAEKRTRVYRDTLLPQADAAFKAATAAYQNNRAEFSSLIDSQTLLLDIQTAMYKAAADRDAGMADLERAIGSKLPDTTGAERNSQ